MSRRIKAKRFRAIIADPWRTRVIGEVRRLSRLLGFEMEWRLAGETDHWMFLIKGRHLMHYWPSNGRWFDVQTGHKGIERSITAVLDMVETILNERKGQCDSSSRLAP